MFIYRPMNVTTHLIVSFSVFRRNKCYATCSNMFYVFFCLIGYPAYTLSIGCFMMFYWWHCVLGAWSWAVIINLSTSPLGLSYIPTPRTFLYLLTVPAELSMHCCLLNSSIFLFSMLDLCWFLIFWAAVSFVILFCFTRLASFCTEYLVCTNPVRLYHCTRWDQQ